MIVNGGNNVNNMNNDMDRAVRRQDANPDARFNALDANWWVAAVAIDNINEIEDLEQPVGRMAGENWGPLPWDDEPFVQEQLDREAEENEAAQELYEPMNLDVDYTIPGGLDGDPRIEHVPALSLQHGDQICEIALDGRHIMFHRCNDGNMEDETIEFPEGFVGRKCRFFDAAGTLCVMAFEADGINTLIYDFHSGQVIGGGSMPEAINWDEGDSLRKVVLLEDVGLQVVITRAEVGIHTIAIGI